MTTRNCKKISSYCYVLCSSLQEFVTKFRILFPKGATATPEQIRQLFEKLELDKRTYQIGKNKVNQIHHV